MDGWRFPFIGSSIFLDRILGPGATPETRAAAKADLARRIVATAVEHRGNLQIRFVTFGAADTRAL